MKIVEIPAEWRARAIVVVDEPLQMSWFAEEELRAAEAFRLQRRRDEYLLSRAAAKNLAMELGLASEPSAIRIGERRIGSRHLSLSHSAPYAAAAIDDAPIGIDAQVVRELSENAAHFFLTDAETAVMHELSLRDRIIHFWCAKEAAWKRQAGVIPTLKGVSLSLESAGADGLRFAEVETVRIGDVVVALTRRTA